MLVYSKFVLSQILTSTVVYGHIAINSHLGILLPVSPESTLSQMHPSRQDASVKSATGGYYLSRVTGKGQVGAGG